MRSSNTHLQKTRSLFLYIAVLFFIVSNSLNAQINSPRGNVKNNIYLQLNVIQSLSVKYERQIIVLNKVIFNVNLGISHTVPNYNSLEYSWYGFPFEFILFTGLNRSHFEFGIGYWHRISYNKTNNSKTEKNYQFKIGYRFQNIKKSGINFRIGLTPTYSTQWDIDYLSTDFTTFWYLTLGYDF